MINRRQYFRGFMKPEPKETPPADRSAGYEQLQTYVRTHLLPNDFDLTDEQELHLFSRVRSLLAAKSNQELFSFLISIKDPVFAQLRAWC